MRYATQPRAAGTAFGSVAAVQHYNVFSRLIAAIFNRLFGIPLVFFDDFAAPLPRLLATKGLAVFARFCALLGIQFKDSESEVGPEITYLGLLVTFPSRPNGCAHSIILPGEKRKARSALSASYVAINRLSYQELEKLIGRRHSRRRSYLGGFTRSQHRPMYTKLRMMVYNASQSAVGRAALLWWVGVIGESPQRYAALDRSISMT